MARLKARSIDRNRLSKKYPFVRAEKRMTFFGDSDIVIELVSITFNNESSKTKVFDEPFVDTAFRVLVSPRDTSVNNSANVALNINDDLTNTSQVTIESSAPFSGIVDVVILRIGS